MNLVKYYRLRNKNKVEGFAKEVSGRTYFKAYNEFNWHQNPLNFDTIDIGVDVYDKRNRRLYTNDIVLYRVSTKPFVRKGFVVFESNSKQFGLIDQETYHFTPFFIDELALFEKDRLEIVSHLFTHSNKTKSE